MFKKTLALIIKEQKIKTILLIFIVVFVLSLTTSVITMTVNAMYKSLSNTVISEKDNILSIYSGSASTPFTGIIKKEYEAKIAAIKGVEKVWSELLVPVTVRGKPVIIRGIEDKFLGELVGIEVNNTLIYNKAWIGEKAARYLGVRAGDYIIAYSLFNNIPALLKIVSVEKMAEPYDNEIIVQLETAQFLRGVSENYVSIVRVVYNPVETNYKKILKEANISLSKRENIQLYLFEKALLLISMTPGKPTALGSTSILERLGLSKDLLIATSIAITLLLSYITLLAGKYIVIVHDHVVKTLNAVGVPISYVKFSLTAIYVPVIITASLLGAITSYYIVDSTNYYMINYKLVPRISYTQLWLMIATYVVLLTLGIVLEKRLEE